MTPKRLGSAPLAASGAKCDVLIVGGGIAGLSSAYFLARAGVDVVLVEAAAALGTHSTGQNAAILRTLIADPLLTAIGRNGAAFLQHPPAGFTSGPLIDPVGLLLTADKGRVGDFETWLAAAGSAPYPECAAEPITKRDARRRAPFLAHPDDAAFAPDEPVGVWMPGEGHIDIAALVAAFAKGATAPGPDGRPARILSSAPLDSLVMAGGSVAGGRLRDGRRIDCARVLFTGGAWAEVLARDAGSPLRFAPRRRHLVVTVPPNPKHPVDPRWPIVWNHSQAPGRSFYARPESPGLLICACDETELAPAGRPDEVSCPPDAACLEDVARAAATFLPDFADAGVHSWWAGWRTFPTGSQVHGGHFAIGADPVVDGLFWAAGLGGHGMTSSFEVGRLAAHALAADLKHAHHATLVGPDYDGAFRPRPAEVAN